jgi:hypothetical protein
MDRAMVVVLLSMLLMALLTLASLTLSSLRPQIPVAPESMEYIVDAKARADHGECDRSSGIYLKEGNGSDSVSQKARPV